MPGQQPEDEYRGYFPRPDCCCPRGTHGAGNGKPAKALGPPPDGMYSFSEPAVPPVTWKIAALCNAPSRQRAIPDFTDPLVWMNLCALNVTSTTPRSPISRQEKLANYTGRASDQRSVDLSGTQA